MRLPILLLTAAASAAAQSPDPRLRPVLDQLRTDNEWTLAQQVQLCAIPAPPFKETARAQEFHRRLHALGLRDVRVDSVGNVIAKRPGTGNGPVVVLSGHLDTVFPEGTEVTPRREGTRISGPGIGDDCRGLAVVLAVARAMQQGNVRTAGPVWFVGTVGEEGEGNLRGVRHLFATEGAQRIDYFISVDGAGDGIASGAVGSNRYRARFRGPGGHSYGAFGLPNPVHAMGRAISAIGDVQVPTTPKTTFNVGVVSGGTSVNSIAAEAVMELDMRSESATALRTLDTRVMTILRDAVAAENARWNVRNGPRAVRLVLDTIGFRPAGMQPDTVRIVRTALETARSLGMTPETSASSTDANVPIGMGRAGIRIGGGGSGSGAHSLHEYYDDGERGWLGPQWALLLVTALAGVR